MVDNAESFHNSQHFMIYSRVIFLHVVELLAIIYYGVKVFGSCTFLEEYSTKCFGTVKGCPSIL